MMLTLEAQIAEAKRELALRRQCYPGWVRRGTLRSEDAKRQILVMAEIVRTLERLEVEERQLSLFGAKPIA
jgi:hypothetical protein